MGKKKSVKKKPTKTRPIKKRSTKKKPTVSKKSNYTRNYIIFLLAVALLGIIWWRITDVKYWQSYELYPAQITRIYQIYAGHYNHMWRVEYQYSVDGKIYTDDEEFWNKSDYGDCQVGDTIYIELSSTTPDASRWRPNAKRND